MSKSYDDSYRNDISVQLDTFSALHFPDHFIEHIILDNMGVGKYSFTAVFRNRFTLENEYFDWRIDKGQMETDARWWRIFPAINIFQLHETPGYSANTLETIEEIEGLPNYIHLNSYISFDEDISIEEFTKIYKEFSQEDLTINWVGVQKNGLLGPLIGFSPKRGVSYGGELEESYPYLDITPYKDDDITPELFEKHFKELLQFQLDNINFLNILETDNVTGNYSRYYNSVLEHINENGINIYGIKAQGTPESILKLTEHEAFVHIIVDDARVKLPR